jgi:HlyD family secretion protein
MSMLDKARNKIEAALVEPGDLTLREPERRPAVLKQRMTASQLRPWRIPLLATVIAAIWLWYSGGAILLGPVLDVEPIIRADLVQSVVASGHVEAPFRVNIGSQIIGIVADIPVAEGQAVKAGDTLIVLDDREAQAALVQAEGGVEQSDARMRQLRELTLPSAEETLKQAQASLTNAEAAFGRAEKLARDGFGTKVNLDEATKALDIARAQVRNAEFQVYTNRPGGSDFVMAEAQRNQARATLATARSRLSYTVIKAPRDGMLISRNAERGNVVQPSNVLMTLSPAGDTELVVQIDEKNLGLIAVGQKALVSADAYPKETFSADVVYVNPGIDLQRASVEVKLRVSEPPAYLRQDMTVSVDIETAMRSAALVAPVANIQGLYGGTPWVMKFENGRAAHRAVKIGIVSGGKAEVLEGLNDGDLVLAAAATVKDGARIRLQSKRSQAK